MDTVVGSSDLSLLAAARAQDCLRHLRDLRTNTYEGASERADREAVFKRAVELLSPVVLRVLEATNATFLAWTGEVQYDPPGPDGARGLRAFWSLSWPEQREARLRMAQGRVSPIQVIAKIGAENTHGHLSGVRAGDWPLQVTTPEDAQRQELIVMAIVEAELHERIFESDLNWRIVPSFARSHAP